MTDKRVYIGPERRKGQRRGTDAHGRCNCGHARAMHWQDAASIAGGRASCTAEGCTCPHYTASTEDRRNAERRQEALAGVITGLSAEDMKTLAGFWQGYEEGRADQEGRS